MKILAVVIIIILLILSVFLSGIIPGFRLPQREQLISVSSVNISPGGEIQNTYVVGTDWDIALTLNSFQNVAAVSLGPSNQTTCGSNTICSGETVAPTSQVYITLTPGQPYVSVNLVPVQSGNGFSNPIVPAVCGYGGNLTIDTGVPLYFSGTEICSSALSSEFYIPASQFWTPHYPVTINVQVVGGQDPGSFTKTVDITNLPGNTVTVSNPSNPAQSITINNLGSLLGNEWPTDVGNLLFYQGGSKCGPTSWCGFGSPSSDAQSALGQYANFWFGSERSFVQRSGVGTPNTAYYSSSCTTPGWGEVYAHATELGVVIRNSYFYYPISPSLTVPTFGVNGNQVLIGQSGLTTEYSQTSTCAGADLTDWLYTHTTSFQNTYSKSLGWSISSNDTLTMLLPSQAVASVATPAITILVPTSLASTAILYQVNNAQFKITTLSASSTSVTAGGYTTVTGTVQNNGNIPGTPQLNYYGNSLFDLSALSLTTLNPGQSETFSLTATGLNTLLSTKNTITFYVENDAGQITDSRQLALTDTPPASVGTPSFAIQGIKGSNTVGVGSEITLNVEVASQGAAGIAYLSTSSENNQIAVVTPVTDNVSIGAGNTETISFSVVGVSIGNTTAYFSVSNGQGQTQTVQTTIVVTGGPGSCPPSCGPGGIPILDYAIGGILVAAAVIVGVWYLKKQ